MTRYLISFDDGAMTFPEADLPDVAKAAHEVVEQAKDFGVWVFGGGVKGHEVSVVATDGSVIGGQSAESKSTSAGSRSSTCHHTWRRWSGLPRSLSPAAVRKRYGRSCRTRPSDRRRPVAPEQHRLGRAV